MTVKQLSKYLNKLVSVTWIDSGSVYFRTDDKPELLSLSKRLTSGIIIYVGPSDNDKDIEICVIASELPAKKDDQFSSYDANSVWVESIVEVKGPKK